jgi:hypothetical protein
MSRALFLASLLAPAAACTEAAGMGALRNPGQECIECHRTGGKAFDHLHTAGGTVYASPGDPPDAGVAGVEVVLRDASGKVVRVTSNAAGNFWIDDPIDFPVSAAVKRAGAASGHASLSPTCTSGRCNGCHTLPPTGGARGRIAAPH